MRCKHPKQTILIVFLVVSVLLSLCLLVLEDIRVGAETIGTVDNSIANGGNPTTAIRLPKQHKTFYALGRYWYFYCNGTAYGFKSSVDGVTWSSMTTIATDAGQSDFFGAYFDVYYNGTHVFYARGRDNYMFSGQLNFRCGVPNSDGSITWLATERQIYYGTKYVADFSIRTDTSGHTYIAYANYSGAYWYPWIIKNALTNGSWQTASGYPFMLANRSNYLPTIVPLLDNKMYAIYGKAKALDAPNVFYGRYFNGSTWQSEETISTSKMATDYYQEWDAIGDPYGYVHLLFINATTKNLLYIRRDNVTGAWGSEEQVYGNMGTATQCALSWHNQNTIYAFWHSAPTSYHVYYKKRANGSWDFSATDWVTDSDSMPNTRNLVTSIKSYNNQILVGWLAKKASPYSAKFCKLTIEGDTTPPTYSSLGTNTTLAGHPCKFYCKWQDNVALSGYIFGTNNTGTWHNETWTSLSGNPTWSNVTKTLNSTVGIKIAYRFWTNDTSNNWADTGLTFLTTSSESVTIEVYDSWVSDSRIDYGAQVTIKFRLRYNTNQTPCETGNAWVNGTSCAINSTGWINYTKTYSAVAKYTFTVTQVNVKGYTNFQMVTSDAEVIWDRLKVDSCGTGDDRADVGSYVVYWWKLKYEYDSIAFTNTKGSCSIGGSPATWSSYYSRWQLNVLLPSTPQLYSRSLTFTDNTYGLTVITGTTSQSVIADRVNIDYFTVYDNRINVGDTASFGVSGKYDYDGSVWSGTYTLNESTSKSTVGKYWYKIQSVTDSIYGLTAIRQTASDIYVIFDKLTVTFSANDTSPDVNEMVTISWTITRQYDSSSVTSFTIDISRNGVLWQTLTNSSKNDVSSEATTRTYTLYPSTVTDNTYGITAAQANSVTVTWGTPPPSAGFNLYFETNGKLAFQHLSVPWETKAATITLTVTSGTLKGTSASLAMYPTSGTLTFTALENGAITLTSTSNGTTFHINGAVANSASIVNGQTYTLEWSFLEPEFLLPIMFILGMFGLGSMFGGPIYGIYKVKHGEYYEGFKTGLILTVLGVALTIAWLWGA